MINALPIPLAGRVKRVTDDTSSKQPSTTATPDMLTTAGKLADLKRRYHEAVTASGDAAIEKHRPDAVAVERVFAQQNVRTVMGTGQVSGLVMVAARRAGLPVVLYTPSEVKAAVTGNGRADKAQVGYMVAKLLGLTEPPKPADAADALAIAAAENWKQP